MPARDHLFRRPLLTAALACCLFFIVAGLKWAIVARFGSAMPDWDQWDAEALKLFVPWFEHDHFVARLFEPHNEHRIVLTKLQNLAVTLLNGQWDSRLECVGNAVVHSALAVAFWLVARTWIGVAPALGGTDGAGRLEADATSPARGHRPAEPLPHACRTPALFDAALFLLTALLFGLPLAWQNILGGFHSQQYWLLGLSFAALVVLPFARPWTAAWWGGAAAAVLALFTMGSGFLVSVVILALVTWRAMRRETTWRAAVPALALVAVLTAVGMVTRVEVYYHEQLKAKTAHDFVFFILRSLEWPIMNHDWVGLVMWAPWAMILWRTVQPRGPAGTRSGLSLLALGAWVLVQIVATAYARGAGAEYPAVRYMDTLALGTLANGIAMAWLFANAARKRNARVGLATLAVAWLAVLGIGFSQLIERNIFHELPDTRSYYVKAEQHMLGYLSTNDPAHLAFPDIPFPSAEGLIERLRHECLRRMMPAEVRPSLAVVSASNTGFRENQASALALETAPRNGLSPKTPALATRTTWGSFGTDGAADQGVWRSAPVQTQLGGWLKFETAGQLGEPGVALELRDAATDALLASVVPTKVPGDAWRAAYVRVPARPFVIVARDSDPNRWLAFGAPVEMAALSHGAWWITKNGLLVAEIAAGLALLLGLGSGVAGCVIRAKLPGAAASP